MVENSGAPPAGQGHEHRLCSTAPRGAQGPRPRPPLGADTSAPGLSRTSSRCRRRRRRRRGCVRRLGSEGVGDLRGAARHGRGGLRFKLWKSYYRGTISFLRMKIYGNSEENISVVITKTLRVRYMQHHTVSPVSQSINKRRAWRGFLQVG
ncbi:uncharacterized protein C17orf67 homolog isoform X2 [Symphalangus syndactylus]|uniref:uncharacterized protein C17orf67 homolog isoform X2 n=1 Tax=Symphalangus syndactylus TaxID=9590 RepID=UPI00300616D0